ncbi:hypothetical protein [Gillisia sp. Hel_I_29]|uniref:hypothetical protein n=1 Tax=Gillisia sp. Hel_I_29 TaxID=1249975 RepID=UPI0005543FFD|nr:hypothetical protein [Gillisia sp. Hel_I_29]
MYWKEIKDYIEIAVLIPSILGGLWQTYELASISTSYIRFFSVSQVIPDGLLILFSGICVFITDKLSFLLRKFLPFYNNKVDSWMVSTITILGYTFIGSVILYFSYIHFIKQEYFQLSDLIFLIFFTITFSCIFYYLLPYSFRKKIKSAFFNRIKKNEEKGNNVLLQIKGMAIMIIGALILIISSKLIQNFRHNYIDIGELQNLKCLKKILKNKSNSANSNIIYFNDKYIFTKTSNSENTEIEIFKTDILFDECGITAYNNGYHK